MVLSRTVLGAILMLVGVVVLGLGGYLLVTELSDVQGSVEVTGAVQSTDIETRTTQADVDDDDAPENQTKYLPVVNYTYSYEGQRYRSESVYPGEDYQFGDRSAAEDVVDRFEPNESVTVYVNSEIPARSYLIQETSTGLYLLIVAMGSVIAGGGLSVYHGLLTPRLFGREE